MRGKLPVLRHQTPGSGLIPAHAGKTFAKPRGYGDTWAHPRACGENDIRHRALPRGTGSSPRMRGKRVLSPPIASPPRLIPAHAGKTLSRFIPRQLCPAHPRACGENDLQDGGACHAWGSSPRMRGKRAWLSSRSWGCGLIPAHAGKTSFRGRNSNGTRAHPRACGENAGLTDKSGRPLGSSPRMRGKPPARNTRNCSSRLIPAHAGKTSNPVADSIISRAHPRACGENRERLNP